LAKSILIEYQIVCGHVSFIFRGHDSLSMIVDECFFGYFTWAIS
jgi:hypothetical protein